MIRSYRLVGKMQHFLIEHYDVRVYKEADYLFCSKSVSFEFLYMVLT